MEHELFLYNLTIRFPLSNLSGTTSNFRYYKINILSANKYEIFYVSYSPPFALYDEMTYFLLYMVIKLVEKIYRLLKKRLTIAHLLDIQDIFK